MGQPKITFGAIGMSFLFSFAVGVFFWLLPGTEGGEFKAGGGVAV